MADSELDKTICIIGSGAAGLISAQVLLKDGFKYVEILTRDHSVGGTWAEERVPPGLKINNVHGEYRFSSLPMPPPAQDKESGGRLSGDDMRLYMESFADKFLKGRIRYDTVVTNIRRIIPGSNGTTTRPWIVSIHDRKSGEESQLAYDRIVLCTGGCSNPQYPPNLTPAVASAQHFSGPVFHSFYIKNHTEELLNVVNPLTSPKPGNAVVIGGGKSAMDTAAFLANHGRKVSLIFETCDIALAASSPLPDFVRKSRFLAVLSPSRQLRTRLERFLHTTWLGSKITHFIWGALAESSFSALGISKGSPLRNTHSVFWSVRIDDEGVPTPERFFSLVKAGKINLITPARAQRFGDDGRSIVLEDGRIIQADAVVLSTGFSSSWKDIVTEEMYDELGLGTHPPLPDDAEYRKEYEYKTLENPEGTGALLLKTKPEAEHAATIYRGLVPARNILKRDFAINGAIFSTNNGYVYEVGAHWIASYFRKDRFLRIPETVEAATQDAERNNSWIRKRFPGMRGWANESYSADMAMLGWPQLVDNLLEDMRLPIMRSGGNWLTWLFKVIDLKEIEHLKEERDENRERAIDFV